MWRALPHTYNENDDDSTYYIVFDENDDSGPSKWWYFSMMNECAEAKIIWEKLSNGDTEENFVSVLNSFETIQVIIISTICIIVKIPNIQRNFLFIILVTFANYEESFVSVMT